MGQDTSSKKIAPQAIAGDSADAGRVTAGEAASTAVFPPVWPASSETDKISDAAPIEAAAPPALQASPFAKSLSKSLPPSPAVPPALPLAQKLNAMPPMPKAAANAVKTAAEAAAAFAPSGEPEPEATTEQPVRRAAKRRPAGPARTQLAANDDIPTIGALIYALEQKPSRQPFKVAAYVSAVWAMLGLGFGYGMLAADMATGTSIWAMLAKPVLLTLSATIVLPIVLFWFLATLVWRAQELRLMSSAMTEVAVRLAEPDRGAEQSVSSLGQTVRKQVNFMNDAVSQAIGRAGELEAMVHSEVSNLERSFQENEQRIRRVLTELASERTQLATTSTDMHTTLRAMGDEVPALIEKLNGQQGKLARIIESAGQNLIALEGSLLKASDKLEGSLGVVSGKIENTLLLASDKIEGALSDRTGHLQQVLDEYTGAINLALGNRTTEMQAVFHDYTMALDATLAQRSNDMSDVLMARTQALDSAFAERVRLFDDSIMRSTSTIDSVIGEKAIALSSAMETHARQLADALGRQSSDIDETLMHGIDAVRRSSENITKQSVKAIEGLSGQADMLRSVSENLLTQIGGVTNRFENQGQSIMRAANALETANFRIDTTLKSRHAELNDTLQKLTGKAGELDAVMQGYSANIEGSMSAAETRARSLTHELSRSAETHARTTLADIERMRQETEQQASRTLSDMHSQFSNVGREMTQQMGTLSSRLSETSEDLRQKTQRAALELKAEQDRLRAEAERIPAATRESTDAMRRVLQEQIRALDQLTSLSNREAARRDVMPPVTPQSTRSPTTLAPPASLTAAWADQARQPQSQPAMQHHLLQQQPAQQQSAQQQHLYQPLPHQQYAQPQYLQPTTQQLPADVPGGQAPGRWSLGDLLSRASETPPPAPVVMTEHNPNAAPGAPINLEVIASALDPDTAAAIWSRYRAGQRGIMVRSIYTPDGRSTFDEVVRRYAGEAVFHGTVDKFLADFERLLRESEARDASGRTMESHLSSPSGRTYLFLAHAAGRLN